MSSTSDDEADADDGVWGERRTYHSCPFPRRRGGSLDLSALLPPPRSATTPLTTIPSRDIAEWTSSSPPSSWRMASMLVAMRVARDDDDNVDGSATRTYVAKIGGLIGTRARLSRF